MIVNLKTGFVFKHRLVMQEKLGRKLHKHETVHHKDGNRLNNHPDNLELWSSRHGRGQRVSDQIEAAQRLLRDYGVPVTPGFPDNTFTMSEAIRGIAACM